jgi:trehalose-6-phosphate synthase
MNVGQNVRLGAWLLIGLNLLMALGSIWVFIRMAPAIEVIIIQNERSLQACEEMLSSLAMMNPNGPDTDQLKASFNAALSRAENNVTEQEEPLALESIRHNYAQAFAGDFEAKAKTVTAIASLSRINREAMAVADKKARQLGNGGAWGVVFMASTVFLVGMLFMRSLKRNLVAPLAEMQAVISALRKGNTLRRCTRMDMPNDIAQVFSEFNEFLDKNIVTDTFPRHNDRS